MTQFKSGDIAIRTIEGKAREVVVIKSYGTEVRVKNPATELTSVCSAHDLELSTY